MLNTSTPLSVKQRGFLPLALLIPLLLISAIAISGAFYLQNYSPVTKIPATNLPVPGIKPKPTPLIFTSSVPVSSNWITYTDSILRFSVQYPSNWSVFPNTIQGYNGTIINSTSELDPRGETLAMQGQVGIVFTIIGFDKQDTETLPQYLKRKFNDFDITDTTITDTTIGQYKAVKIKSAPDQTSIIYINNTKTIYQISVQIKNEGYKETVDRILSTFKFLPASPDQN